jgi:hypothetical protein
MMTHVLYDVTDGDVITKVQKVTRTKVFSFFYRFKDENLSVLFIDLVVVAQATLFVSVIKTSQLMLHRKVTGCITRSV